MRNGIPLRSRLLGQVKWLNHLGSLTAPLSNQLLNFRPLRRALETSTGIAADRPLPPFAALPFDFRFRRRPPVHPDKPAVVLFNDCYMNYNHPEVGEATVRLLEACGQRVIVPPQVCCGRPLISTGQLEAARQSARRTLDILAPYVAQGLDIIGCEPSCLLSFRDEYPDFYPRAGEALARQSLTLQEWLVKQPAADLFRAGSGQVFYHEHCHQKALVGPEAALQALQRVPDLEVIMSRAGCCGMAGSFGYEREHVAMSRAIAGERLLPALKRYPQAEIGVSGISCRHQIEAETGRPVKHLAEILAERLY